MSDRLLELYIKTFLKGELDFNGITLIPYLTKEDGKSIIKWDLKNPNDLPFYYIPIDDVIFQSFYEFYRITGGTKDKDNIYTNEYKKIVKHFNFPKKYIPQKLYDDLNSHIGKKGKVSYLDVEFEYKILNYVLFIVDDMVEFYCEVDISSAWVTSTGDELSYDNLFKFLDKLASSGDIGDINDAVISPLDEEILKHKTLMDRFEMYLSNQVTYLYRGDKLI